jgi:hypothetical protein
MDQRAPRLGDTVDDYCPRERRITNHAVVAIVDDAIRQTRCTTCDAEHVFKGGREPRRRKPDETAFDEVLASVTSRAEARPVVPAAIARASAPQQTAEAPRPVAATAAPVEEPQGEASAEANGNRIDDAVVAGPGHRRLIRASLPRTDGDVPAPRPIPEFTMHQRPSGRGGRPPRTGDDGEVNGNVVNYPGHHRELRHGRQAHGHDHGNANGHNGHGSGHGFGRHREGPPNGHANGHGGQAPGGAGRRRRRGRHKRAH